MINRIIDPEKISRTSILNAMGDWGLPVIQFSKPGQSKTLFRSINALCKVFGKRLPIRFYSHGRNGFDASILKQLPDVQWLLVDCLQEISNPEIIFELPKLKKLSFGVYNYDNPNFLHQLNIGKLEQLSLGRTRKPNFDLAALQSGNKIESLLIEGHHKGISVIGEMENLQSLRLFSIGKTVDLEFVSRIAKLESLEILLGGRSNINEITHPMLKELKIRRVRGLDALGDLSRFPKLQRLHVEDQIKLLSISLQNPELSDLKILTCKSLNALHGLEALKKIKTVRCYETALDYEQMSELNWAKTLKVLALYSGSKKRDEILRQKLNAKGFKEYS